MSAEGGHQYREILERMTFRLGTQERYMDFGLSPKWEVPDKVIVGIAPTKFAVA